MMFSWMIVLDVTRMMTLHHARMNIMRFHVAIFGQKTTITNNGTILTSAGVEHNLDRSSHLLDVFLESVANL